MANLKLAKRQRPNPGPGQVLLRMRASSLNYRAGRGFDHIVELGEQMQYRSPPLREPSARV